jgi:hypothetical protein
MTIKIGFLWMEKYRSKTPGRGFGALFGLAFLFFVALPYLLSILSGLLGWSDSYLFFLLLVCAVLVAIELPLAMTNRWGLIDWAPGVFSVDLTSSAFRKRKKG